MINLRARKVRLVPASERDVPQLVAWRNTRDYMDTCTTNPNQVTMDDIRLMLNRRPFQFMIVHDTHGRIGTIYANKENFADKHLYITTYLDSAYRALGSGPLALMLAITYAFSKYALRKIYFDVYAVNTKSRSCFEGGLGRLGFIQEAVHRDHRFQGGGYLDLIRYAIFSESVPTIEAFIARANRLDDENPSLPDDRGSFFEGLGI